MERLRGGLSGASLWSTLDTLFRRAALNLLQPRRPAVALLLSAGLFALFHVPGWAILGTVLPADIPATLVTLFVYGLVFGALYRTTGSLWASLLPHITNNILLEAFAG